MRISDWSSDVCSSALRGGQMAEDAGNHVVEVARELVDLAGALLAGLALLLLLGGERVGPDHVVLEDLDGGGHEPDLVGAALSRDLGRLVDRKSTRLNSSH